MRKLACCSMAAGALLLLLAGLLFCGHLRAERRAADGAERELLRLTEETGLHRETEETGREAHVRPAAAPEAPILVQPPRPDLDDAEFLGLLELLPAGVQLPVYRDWDEKMLRFAPCRYSGAPGQTLVIAGHNYGAHFASLSALQPGDLVQLTECDGTVWSYQVAQAEILAADGIDALYAGDWPLTLFTCTADGEERLAVRCERREARETR